MLLWPLKKLLPQQPVPSQFSLNHCCSVSDIIRTAVRPALPTAPAVLISPGAAAQCTSIMGGWTKNKGKLLVRNVHLIDFMLIGLHRRPLLRGSWTSEIIKANKYSYWLPGTWALHFRTMRKPESKTGKVLFSKHPQSETIMLNPGFLMLCKK